MMRSRRRNVLAAVAAALCLALMAGCSGAGDVPSQLGDAFGSVLDSVRNATSVADAREQRRSELSPVVSDDELVTPGTLTVGVKATSGAPLVISGEGDPEGIDVDTARALATELGLANVEFVSVQNASAGLSEGCDIVMGVEAGEDESVATIGSYAQSALGVFSSTEAAGPIAATDLAGATVGVQEGSVSQAALRSLGVNVVEQTFSNLNDAIEALGQGTLDYVVCDAYSGAYLSCVYDAGYFVGTVDAPVSVGVAVAADATGLQTSIQAALDSIQTNGVADVARSRWIGDFPVLTEATRLAGVS